MKRLDPFGEILWKEATLIGDLMNADEPALVEILLLALGALDDHDEVLLGERQLVELFRLVRIGRAHSVHHLVFHDCCCRCCCLCLGHCAG